MTMSGPCARDKGGIALLFHSTCPVVAIAELVRHQLRPYRRRTRYLIALLPVFLSACSTPPSVENTPTPQMVIYHVKPGSEQQLEVVLTETWRAYMKEQRVHSDPHVLVRIREDATHDCFVEIFTLVGFHAVEHPSVAVRGLWEQAQALCEDRDGQRAVQYRGITKMIAPREPELPE